MKKSFLFGILLSLVASIFFVGSISDTSTAASHMKINKKPSVSPTITIIPSPTIKPTSFPTLTPTAILLPTATPVAYQNYGWYTHEGKSMQYVNGSWFTEPQQEKPKAPSASTPTESSSNSSPSNPTASTPAPTSLSNSERTYHNGSIIGQPCHRILSDSWCQACEAQNMSAEHCYLWYRRSWGF